MGVECALGCSLHWCSPASAASSSPHAGQAHMTSGCQAAPRWRSLPFLRIYIAVTHPRSRNACQAAHCARALRILCGRLRMGHDRQGAAAAAAAARGTGRGG